MFHFLLEIMRQQPAVEEQFFLNRIYYIFSKTKKAI